MANLSLRSLSKEFGKHTIVSSIDLDVGDQEFVVLLGPSGCGKTTILRMIGGLEKVTSGQIILDNEVINDVPPQERDMAMVFQNYALYAHLSVFDNLAFGLRMHNVPKDQVRGRVTAVAQMLQIEPLLERKPRQLSGGERQRVALGRAIVRQPRLFLMDEPLSNLDALLRTQTRTEILQLCQKIGATVLYVTHDQTEAMTMGQRVVLLNDGVIQQVEAPLRIYYQPANRFVGEFVGSPPMNFVEDAELYRDGEKLWVRTQEFRLGPVSPECQSAIEHGRELTSRSIVLGIRPEDLTWGVAGEPGTSISGVVEVVEPLGRDVLLFINAGGHLIRALVDPNVAQEVGGSVVLSVDIRRLHLFDKSTGKNLAVHAKQAA